MLILKYSINPICWEQNIWMIALLGHEFVMERTSISNRFSETSRSRGQRPPQHPQMRQTPSQVIVYNDFGEEHKRKPKVLDPHKYKVTR